jgi:hypothetical protein
VIVVLICVALVAIGMAMVVRWSVPALAASAGAEPVSWRRWLSRWAAVAIASGFVAGLLAAGAGGRLVMRLLAETSAGSAGQVTEAEATIGEITAGGTLGFVLFGGIPFGVASGVLYLAVGPLLPRRWTAGLLFGLLLLVIGSTRLDPLRADNFDFNLLGPDWLAVAAFVTLVLFHGMLVVAVGRRLSRTWLPSTAPPVPQERRNPALVGGRVATGAVALVALPGFVGALTDIL